MQAGSANGQISIPQFIRDEVAPVDRFGAHNRLAVAIAHVVKSNAQFRVIGLVGAWGSGKSTVAKLTQNLLSADGEGIDYKFFYYDAWLHQNDPPRRSFLERLLRFLIDSGIASENDWREEINSITRQSEQTETTATPQLTSSGRIIALSLLGVPIGLEFVNHEWFMAAYGRNWVEALLHIEDPTAGRFFFPLGVAFLTAPLWAFAGIAIARKLQKKRTGDQGTQEEKVRDESIWSLLSNKETTTTKTRLTRSPDPTAIEFQKTFRKLIKAVTTERRRLVFVIDNLDRLPEADALAMWSTVRSVFLGVEDVDVKAPNGAASVNLPPPTIILPIDEGAVERMFNATHPVGEAGGELAKSFMDKTFDLTFRVPAPVLSEWSKYFQDQLKFAYGDGINERDVFNATNILRDKLVNDGRAVTPRKPSGSIPTGLAPPPAAAVSASPAQAPPAPPRRLAAKPPRPTPSPLLRANAAARSYPTPGAYINSTVFFDYEAGRLYDVETSPHFLTTILLRPGEKLLAKASGDTVRWVLGETAEGSGPNTQVVVLLKPIRGGLRTNLVLTTDQRIYLIEASSHEGGAYTSAVSWNYAQEQMQALAAAEAAKAASLVDKPAVPVDQLHFGYKIEPLHAKPPRWQPLRVFDDGTKTYIQFPVNMAATDAPPLFLVGPKDTAELVNYRYINGYYIVDRLIDRAELRIGEAPQVIVRITRTQGG